MRHSALRIMRRGLATAAAHPPHASPSASHVTASTSAIPLSNVEAQWAALSPTEQTAVHQQLEELQRKDWKTLSLAEKKAGTSLFPSPSPFLLSRMEETDDELVVLSYKLTMSRLARMVPVRRSTPPVRPSRSSPAFLPSLPPPVCSTPGSAPSVCGCFASHVN
jgi:hypothetical protein